MLALRRCLQQAVSNFAKKTAERLCFELKAQDSQPLILSFTTPICVLKAFSL
jgi:hypothetical protein